MGKAFYVTSQVAKKCFVIKRVPSCLCERKVYMCFNTRLCRKFLCLQDNSVTPYTPYANSRSRP